MTNGCCLKDNILSTCSFCLSCVDSFLVWSDFLFVCN